MSFRNTNSSYNCIFILYTCMLLCISVIVYTLIHKDAEYHEHLCDIVTVEYPTELPTQDNSENWAECDCGKNCVSLTPCINLYASVKPDMKIMNYYLNDNSPCTFWDSKCTNIDNDPLSMAQKLNNSIIEAESYINSSLTCYYNHDVDAIYLNKTTYSYLIISGAILLLIWCICCIKIVNVNVNEYIENRNLKKNTVETDCVIPIYSDFQTEYNKDANFEFYTIVE